MPVSSRQGARLPYLLITLWVLVMISIPVVRWLAGDDVMPFVVTLSVTLQAAASISVLWAAWGSRPVALVAVTVFPLAWLVEYVGSTTGVPFGAYDYTTALWPQIGGVPLLIPLAWLMMLPPAWAVAAALTAHRGRAAFVVITALAFTAWDLFLDPQMVAWGYWVWAHPGGYFGIPWTNYAGWLLASAMLTTAVYAPPWRPPPPPVRPLLLIYTITWVLQSLGLALFWEMPGPALAGAVAMGLFVVLAWRRVLQRAATGQAPAPPARSRLTNA